MSNDIVEFGSNKIPAYLIEAAQEFGSDEFDSGISSSFPLPTLSIRGKEWRFRKDGQEVSTKQRDLSCVIVAARPRLIKRFHSKPYVEGAIEPPSCSSMDGITPNVADPVSPSCVTCPNNAWGSGKNAQGEPTNGKACKDYKRLIVWPIGTHDEPVALDVPPASLKRGKEFKGSEMLMGEYFAALKKHGLNPSVVATHMEFTGASSPQIAFSFERALTQEELETVRKMRESEDVQTVLNEDVNEEPVQIVQVAEKAPEPIAQENPKPAVRRPAPPKPAPEPEPEVEYDSETDAYSDAEPLETPDNSLLMSKLTEMLKKSKSA